LALGPTDAVDETTLSGDLGLADSLDTHVERARDVVSLAVHRDAYARPTQALIVVRAEITVVARCAIGARR